MKKKMIIFAICFVSCISFLGISNTRATKEQYILNMDYVPNAETAIKVAEAIWLPIYGEKIYENRPFRASLTNANVWIVEGTTMKETKGGVPYIEIQKKDCKILKFLMANNRQFEFSGIF
jgi:hypothetical protein